MAGVKCCFVDFGISVHTPEDEYPRLVTGNLGRNQTIPELPNTIKYDPFKLDVHITGNMLKLELTDICVSLSIRSVTPMVLTVLKEFTNLEILFPLVKIMTQADPRQRPSAQEALDCWREIKKTVGTIRGE